VIAKITVILVMLALLIAGLLVSPTTDPVPAYGNEMTRETYEHGGC
jgi:hypothetical protein